MSRLCICGHDQAEHHDERYGTIVTTTCTGNTWAYPPDAERDSDAREVRCMCSGYDAAHDGVLRAWGVPIPRANDAAYDAGARSERMGE